MAAFEWFVSLRYLRAKRKQKFISLITIISILGVAVGVLALIVVLSVYTGFTEGLRDQIIGVNAHALVQRFGTAITDTEAVTAAIEAVPGVEATTPYMYGQALISSATQSTGVVLRGIDAASAMRVLSIGEKMVAGQLTDLDKPAEVPAIVLGRDMARQIQVGVGDRVRLISPNGPLSPMGVLPKIRTCVVVGLFETGMFEYDSTMGYINLDTARSLTDLRRGVHGIEVRVRDIDQADRTAAAIQQALGHGYAVRDWMQLNRNLFAALKLEKIGIFIALDLIILVAALNIISALIMMVMEKNRDIAILKSMGATTRAIMRIFFYQGMVIGLAGTVLGVAGGLGLCGLLKRYKIIELPSNVYPMSTMPIKVVPLDVTVIAVSAILITLFATLYPSWKASRVRPAEALSYE
ncbi:lipoprotein-releasing ABC transporter permease subunit [Desulfobulbus elongatus]|uniref:lipoprotein-releasing ABC transporter permease subunit n=1 Tax=Desulfobulbus elongatus TaxID=53332 RepID=UPI00048873CF|nr:lipoprotein-releasing ABC transporter permease subunit [Desulfobulbus elongatus]